MVSGQTHGRRWTYSDLDSYARVGLMDGTTDMPAAKMAIEGTLEHRGHAVWWGRAGEASSDNAAPLLTVHGGPGICHDCLEPLAELAADRPVYFYDQYGCGRSDRAVEAGEYDVELFVDELATVREELGLNDVHLYAHSYGGPLLLEYMLRRQPEGVLSLTLSNTFASTRDLARGWSRRLSELPVESGEALRAGPSNEAYAQGLHEFITRFVLPGSPPEPLMRSQQHSGGEVYERMHGSSWFEPNGEWSAWDSTSRLHMIKVPTLVIGGTRDQCVPQLAEALAAGIPHAELVILEAAHLPFYEVADEYLELLRHFLAQSSHEAPRNRAQTSPVAADPPTRTQ